MTYTPHEEIYKGYHIAIEHDEYPSNPRDDIRRGGDDNVGVLVTWERDYGSPDGDERGKPEFGMHDFDQETMECIVHPPYVYGERFDPSIKREYTYKVTPDNLYDGSFMAYRWQRRKERKSKDDGLIILSIDRQYDGSLTVYDYDEHAYGSETRYRRGTYSGVAYITYERAREEWGEGKRKRLTPKARQLALDYLKGEVERYSNWATGNVWGYVITHPRDPDKILASCHGFNGDWDEDDYCLTQAREAVDCIIAARQEDAEGDEGTYADPSELAEMREALTNVAD